MSAPPPPRFSVADFVAAASLSCIAALASCSSDSTAGPATDPVPVIRAFPTSCVPETFVTVTDSTETVRTTFSNPDPSCYPNLVQWGVDMADPAGVDTPQGTSAWIMKSNLPVTNAPSPGHVAQPASYTPPQVMIEFDPPVRSVSFYYSRLLQERARWGGQTVLADSMRVYAMYRMPGSTFYQTLVLRTLYSNVQSTTAPWTNWTRVEMIAPVDSIQWLWFDGGLLIDDLEFTRAPLRCKSPVERGREVTCTMQSTTWTPTAWEFTPDSGSALPPVQEQSANSQWVGVAAVSGTVTVTATDGMTSRTFKQQLSVLNRLSQWASKQTYRVGPELTAPDVEPGLGVSLGRNCIVAPLCAPYYRLEPDPFQFVDSGYVVTPVTSGPNKGYWLVTQPTFSMSRVANVNPAILPASPRVHQLPYSVPKKCKQALGFGPKDTASANFHMYNDKCQGINMAAFVDAVLGHEGLGFNGGVGHESLARQAASDPANDPYASTDTLVRPDSAALAGEVWLTLTAIAEDLSNRADDSTNTGPTTAVPNGNFSGGPIWFWSVAAGLFQQIGINGF